MLLRSALQGLELLPGLHEVLLPALVVVGSRDGVVVVREAVLLLRFALQETFFFDGTLFVFFQEPFLGMNMGHGEDKVGRWNQAREHFARTIAPRCPRTPISYVCVWTLDSIQYILQKSSRRLCYREEMSAKKARLRCAEKLEKSGAVLLKLVYVEHKTFPKRGRKIRPGLYWHFQFKFAPTFRRKTYLELEWGHFCSIKNNGVNVSYAVLSNRHAELGCAFFASSEGGVRVQRSRIFSTIDCRHG